MINNEIRNPLGHIEDNNTVYTFTDWTSAAKMRNFLNPLLRIDIGILRDLTEDIDEIIGYQLTVYNVNTQVIIYKFYIDYIKNGIFSLTTDEALTVLNQIGFNCRYEEEIVLSENARNILEACQTMGYTHINRIVGCPDFLLTTAMSSKEAESVTGMPLSELFAKTGKYINLHDFRFLDRIPMSIKELLRKEE